MEQNYFAVLSGRICGVYNSKTEAEYQIEGYPDGFYETYASLDEAQGAIEMFLSENLLSPDTETTFYLNGQFKYGD